jgi:very-short-patch-repair endonuclease
MLEPRTRRELLTEGRTGREIAAAVHRGELIRARRGHYLPSTAPPALIAAVRVGGRLACVSELRSRGIWVVDDQRVHVHVSPHASRLRDPTDRGRPHSPDAGARTHWQDLRDPTRASAGHVSVADALLQSAGCLPARLLAASLDSALRAGLSLAAQRILMIDPVLRGLLAHADSSAGSGLETIVRELARDLGFVVRTQVPIDGVGFVDVVIEDRIVVEADGLAFHSGAAVARDRRRDAAIVATGRTVLRFGYPQIVGEPETVARSLIAAVASHRGVRNSGRKAQIARRRARRAGLA